MNEPGFCVWPDDVAHLIRKVRLLADKCDYFVFSGSCPPGLPDDVYASLIQELSATAPCALDTDARWLRPGLLASPALIKPNLEELEQTIGQKLVSEQDIIRACTHLATKHAIRLILVSLGVEGSLLVAGHEAYRVPALPVAVQSTVGAGDALLAGFLDALARQFSLQEALAWATACGTMAVSCSDRTVFNRPEAGRLAQQVLNQVRDVSKQS
jgi:1-phosphofructokinase